MKKLMTTLLALCLTASLFCMPALAAADGSDLHLLGSKEDHLRDYNFTASSAYAPAEGEPGFGIVGIGEQTEFWVSYMFTEPGSEGEAPAFANEGVALYNRGQKREINGVYLDGVFYPATEKTYAPYNGVQQIVLANSTGEMIPTHSADLLNTPKDTSVTYNMISLEEGYYNSTEIAAKLRAVAANGYWGGVSDVNEDGIDLMKAMMEKSGEFTDEEIDMLSPGVALSATQFAIWELINADEEDGRKVVNVQYIERARVTGVNGNAWNKLKVTPASEVPCVDLIFKLSNYLVNLPGISIEEETTANTILSNENILNNVEITADSVTFDMLQASENDDLVAKIVDANGDTVATGRIAGTAQEGEVELTKNDGTYTFNIALAEGTYTVVVEGTQDLSGSAFIYTAGARETSETMIGFGAVSSAVNVASETVEYTVEETQPEPVAPSFRVIISYVDQATSEEISADYMGDFIDEGNAYDVTAQAAKAIAGYTFVGTTGDALTGTMDTDKSITALYVKNSGTVEIPEEQPPLADDEQINNEQADDTIIIDEEDIPLADVPETGDPLTVMAAMSILSGAGVYFTRKKRDEE